MRNLFLVTMLLFVFVISAQAQEARVSDTYKQFHDSETILYDTNNVPYFTMTNTDTATGISNTIAGGANGDVRISVMADTVSGTLSATVYVGIKLGDFGSDALDYKWLTLGTLSASDDHVPVTYLLKDVTGWSAPVENYKIKIITSGTHSTRFYISKIQFYPRRG